MPEGVAKLADVMGRDAGRHADGDPGGPVGQQVGKAGRQYRRFGFLAVVGIAEIDGVLVDAFQQRPGDLGQPRFRITHGRRVIAIDVAEITLPFDQRITLGEFLGHPHHGVVNGDVSVGVVFTDDVADNPGAFLEPGLGVQLQHAHGVKQPPVHRLQTVADIGQRTRNDG